MYLAALLLVVSFSQLCHSFILPITKPDGSIDFDNLISFATFLDKNMATIMQITNSQRIELEKLKAGMASLTMENTALHSRVNVLESSLTSEVASLKSKLDTTNTMLRSVSNQTNTTVTDITDLKTSFSLQTNMTNSFINKNRNDLQRLHTELKSVYNQFNTKFTNLNNLTQSLRPDTKLTSSLVHDINKTRQELKTFYIDLKSVSSQVNTTVMEFKNIKQSLQTEKNLTKSLTRDTNKNRHDLQTFRNDLTKLESTTIVDLNSSISALQSESNSTSYALNTLRSVTARLDTSVSFQVDLVIPKNKLTIQVTKGEAVKFGNIILQTDNSYNPSTGNFTAPVTGTYLFWVNLDQVVGQPAEIEFRHSRIGTIAFSYTMAPFDTSIALTAATKVSAGESVCVVARQTFTVQTGAYTQFGGTLLHRT